MIQLQQLAQEMLAGAGAIALYLAIVAPIAILIRRFTPINDELFRKMLHMILIVALMF